ncbi:hypothetical protein JST56_04450 [Candidatus Dependentiae bacterium]|jgi:hypothetical protein|nr:hypothetical protein [Candidatus Dependentiae bacterium]
MKQQSIKFLTKTKLWLLYFAYTQVVVTLVALPVLVSWGLGMSTMTFVGNLIFTPLLSCFLLTSSLIFFSELLCIPNDYLIICLEHITTWWYWLLSLGKSSWIIYFAKPPTWTLFIIPCAALFIIRTNSISSLPKRLAWSSGLLVLALGAFHCFTLHAKRTPKTLKLFGKLIIQNSGTQITVTDCGYLNRRKSVDKFIEYELKPALITTFGTPTIDQIVLKKPGSGSFATAASLCASKLVKSIVLPYFEPLTSKAAWAEFFKMRTAAQKHEVTITRAL